MKKFLALLAAVVVATIAFALAAGTAVAAPPDTTPEEECVPTGVPVTDVETGETYTYGIPSLVGYDSCAQVDETTGEIVGNRIPDICVQWQDGNYSRLWSVLECTPENVETVEPPQAPVTTQPPANAVVSTASATGTLPATGTITDVIVVIAAVILAVGALAYIASRFNRY